MEIIPYTPDLYEQLILFLVESFPNRDKRYFDWWLKQYSCEKNLLNRTFLVEDKGKIIACTTANWNEIKIHGKKQDFYWEGNTIVLKAYRGKGVGRMIYEQMGRFSDRCVVGLTDAAYNIQPKIIPCFRPINPVYVYLSVNRFFLNSLYRRCLHYRRGIEDMFYPLKMAVRGMMFYRIDKLEQMSFTSDGFWQNDDIEIIRDKSFFEKRFFNIYKKYVVYEGYLCRNLVYYFVVRVAHYKGFDVVSLVDFRYRKEDYVNSIHKAVSEIAKMNRIGFYLTLSSLKRKVLDFFPIILRTSKKLYGGTTIPHINKECSLLITSADSDLDFVYYL